jgi:mono/diheme cytochrome c family protein
MSEDNSKAKHQPHPGSRESLEKAGYQDKQIQDVHAQLMREKDEPTEGFTPVPLFTLFLFAIIVFWGGVYFTKYSGDFRWDVYDPNQRGESVVAEAPAFDPIARGSRVYRNRCAQCHQAEGQGVAGVYPTLVGTEWVTGSDERLVKILLHGLEGEIVVRGNTYNGAMPAFGPGPGGLNIGDRDIGAVVTFIRQAWGNNAEAISEERVAEVREAIGNRGPWDGAELLNLHPLSR